MRKGEEISRGKAKSLYRTDDPSRLIMEFRDDTSAFDGEKKAKLERKGEVNNQINAFIMAVLGKAGIATHFERLLNERESLVKKLRMVPVECVMRNIAAGSLCRRLGIEEGIDLDPPLFEFFLKNDALHDPLVNENHIRAFGWATQAEIEQMKEITQAVNQVLVRLFADAGILLVDYKIEFGEFEGELLLGDEMTPDGCRLWDVETRRKLDKDRFRRDLGGVVEAYEEVARRLGVAIR